MDSLSILGLKFRVVWVDELRDESDDLDGEVDFNALEIRVKKGQSARNTACTVLHEVTHCILRMAGVAHLLNSYHPELEETVCRALEYGLAGTLADNPELRRMVEG